MSLAISCALEHVIQTCGVIPWVLSIFSHTDYRAPICSLITCSRAGIKVTQVAILSFFAPQGPLVRRINVKFGTMGPSVVVNFTLIGPYLGVSGPKNTKTREICAISVKFLLFTYYV